MTRTMRHSRITVMPSNLDRPRGAQRAEDKMVAPDGKRDWCRIENKAKGEADVYIYDEIGYWGTTATAFSEQLRDLDVATINLHLNSPGGEVWDGVAIYNTLVDHKAKVVVIVDGLAASAASFIAQAGDEVVMQQGATMMIHDASSMFWGNADEMRRGATVLDKVSDNIAGIYAERAGETKEFWRALMKEEVWYDADETVAAGLADRVASRKSDDETEDATNKWNLGVFNHQGRAAAPSPTTVRNRVLNKIEENSMPEDEQVEETKADETVEETPAADETVEETPAADETETAEEDEPGSDAEAQAAATAVENTVRGRGEAGVLINGVLVTDMTAVQNHISSLEQFASESKASARESFVDSLVKDGKMFAAQGEKAKEFVAGLTDEAYAQYVAMQKDAPPLPALGRHTGASDSHVNAADAAIVDRVGILQDIVKRHRDGGLPEEKVQNTSSYKELQTLLAQQGTQAQN